MPWLNIPWTPAWERLALVTFVASILAIAYAYVGYAFLLRIGSALLRQRPRPLTHTPNITMIICARNEHLHLRRKLEETLALHYPPERLEILVVSDGSSDGTDEIAQEFADRGVRLIRLNRQFGKTHAQNVAAKCARGEILVFSDVTACYEPDALLALAANFLDAHVGAVSGAYRYTNAGASVSTQQGSRAFSSYDNQLRQWQSDIASITGCCGCIYALRTTLYTQLDDDIISDLVQPLHVLSKGFRVVYEPRAVALEESTSTNSSEFRMRVRVVTRAMVGLTSVPTLLAPWRHPYTSFQILSHKFMRWSVAYFQLTLLISTAALAQKSALFMALLVAQLAFYAFALLTLFLPLGRLWRPLSLPLYLCTVNAAAALGIVQYLRGKRYTVWQPDREALHARH